MVLGRFISKEDLTSKEIDIPKSEWRLSQWGDNSAGDVGPAGSNPRELSKLRYINICRPYIFVVPADITDIKLRCIIERFAPTNANAYSFGEEIYFGSTLRMGGSIHANPKQSLECRIFSAQYIRDLSK